MAKQAASNAGEGRKWRDKLAREHSSHGKVVEIAAAKRKPGGPKSLLIPDPRELDALLRRVRKGTVLRLGKLRTDLVQGTQADVACPLVTGIFLRMVAEAAEEDRKDGKQRITPYWRVVRDDGGLFEKFPGGVAAQQRLLKAEGHSFLRGKWVPKAHA